ncbi:MAG: hydrogenase 4 subunit B [Geminicoccaceae bacterium]
MLIGAVLLPLLGVLLLTAGAGLSARLARPTLVYGVCLAVIAVLVAVAIAVLGSGTTTEIALPLGLPWLGAHLRVDALAAFFMLVVNLGAGIVSLYALGYGRDETEPRRVLPFYPAFLAGMNLVLLAADAFTFLFAWEVMSLTSWALVLRDGRREECRDAAWLYLVMAGFGTLCLLLCFGLLAGSSGAYAFATIRQLPPTGLIAGFVFLLALLGTGSKAGLVPLHVWLPPAHAAAPSHVSALMSGVMTKVAAYGAIRILFDLLGEPGWWWGSVLMLVGGISAVLGLLYALMQTDLKRVLACSTIENLGLVFVGLGLALTYRANGLPLLAALALAAALLHALNHALFKGLLFMGAGAVLHATGERELDRLGGLIHALPVTSAVVLVGAAAISALPPLNGFVSEWLLFQAILQTPQLPEAVLRFLSPAVGALLALAAALAAACFVRAYGIVFLGRPRSDAARNAHEVDRLSLAAMIVAAALCVLIGIFPGPVIDLLGQAVAEMNSGVRLAAQGGQGWLSLVPVDAKHSSYNGLVLLLFITVSSTSVIWAVHRFANKTLRRSPAWDCGYPDPSPLTQYGAVSFAQPIRRVFASTVFGAKDTVTMPAPGDLAPATFRLAWKDPIWRGIYVPVAKAVEIVADRLNVLQYLTVRSYLTMTFGALITLLLVVAAWR